QSAARDGEVELRGSELEVAAPFRFWIEAERDVRGQVAGWCGVGEIEDVLAGHQAPVGEGRIAGSEQLEAEPEYGSRPSREVRADERAGRSCAEDRSIPDV